ncbi:MAG: hypothetical protein ACO1RX_09165 [Candidatus Sericytochromatia bacterium]
MPNLDGRVNNLNRDVASTLQRLQRANPGSITEAGAQELKTAILKDNNIDANEQDLLNELTQDKVKSISVYAEGIANPVAVTYSATGRSKAILESMGNPQENLSALWSQGQAGYKRLTEIYARSPSDAKKVTDFVAGKLQSAWDQSNMGNGYKPLRDLIGSTYGFATSNTGESVTQGRNLLHASMKQVDQQANDRIPDFLYNWVRPGGLL